MAAAPVHARTYLVLPAPSSMAAPYWVHDSRQPSHEVLVCASAADILTGTCQPYRKSLRR